MVQFTVSKDLLCLDGPRVPVTTPALANHGHEYGCEELSRDEKAQAYPLPQDALIDHRDTDAVERFLKSA